MASVFTYDPDPPRVSSPWILADDADTSPASGAAVTQTGLLSEYGVTRLDAEPQTGPIEYKLHLLLRSRRSYVYMSTVDQKRDRLHAQPGDGSALYSASPASYSASPTPASSSQPRQERLQRLTTQLLWRLQQSSPYHASSSREVKIPKLPDGNADTDSPDLYGTQIPGLEESQGALYEIGVSDDGHLVGLAKDELDESIATLRVMAASLGCGVTVLRMVNVGDCEWIEIADLSGNASQGPTQITKRDRLWVAEALITPSTELLHSKDTRRYNESADGTPLDSAASTTVPGHGKSATPQLRVTLTGPIASGKSSLLGTLSTGTLDNGRGKSRLSLLKHRHEMASGMTSSIAQELIGYQERLIFSFSHRNIESWLDIHDYANDGRLVFMSDSGGHPRYRHTVFRGLMNWAPHWMVLCVAADDADEMTSRAHDVTAPAPDSGETDLVKAHLDLSLKLDVPLAIVITKLDLASKVALQKTMTKILGAIRDADRVPKLLQPDQQPRDQLSEIPQTDWDKVQSFVGNISEHGDLLKHVPIVFTSVLKGVGIGLVHALLASLPLPPAPTPHGSKDATPQSQQPRNLFHIDDTFSLPRSFDDSLANLDGVIVSGHVRLGSFSIGQTIVVGPFSSSHALDRGSGTEYHSSPEGRGSPALRVISATHPNGNKSGSISPSTDPDEWQKARIVSIRNLRLPVGTLEAGQVGSIGLVFETDRSDLTVLPDTPQIRRGMVISTPTLDMPDNEIPLHASHGVIAVFEEDSAQFPPSGTLVNILFACVRTAARILDVSVQHRGEAGETIGPLDADHKAETTKDSLGDTVTKVTLELVHSRKWAEPGSSVIIMGNGSHDGSGLQGFVGKITDVMC